MARAQVRWGRPQPPFLLQLQEPQQRGQRPSTIGPPRLLLPSVLALYYLLKPLGLTFHHEINT